MTCFEQIQAWLTEQGVAFETLHHAPTPTSEASAAARGEALANGAKALVMKCGDRFALFVLSAARWLDARAVRKHLGVKKTRFATPDELHALTGLVPGAVPPFGRPILDLDLYIDTSITHLNRVAFNAGSLTDSITMAAADYLRLAGGEVFTFSDT